MDQLRFHYRFSVCSGLAGDYKGLMGNIALLSIPFAHYRDYRMYVALEYSLGACVRVSAYRIWARGNIQNRLRRVLGK